MIVLLFDHNDVVEKAIFRILQIFITVALQPNVASISFIDDALHRRATLPNALVGKMILLIRKRTNNQEQSIFN